MTESRQRVPSGHWSLPHWSSVHCPAQQRVSLGQAWFAQRSAAHWPVLGSQAEPPSQTTWAQRSSTQAPPTQASVAAQSTSVQRPAQWPVEESQYCRVASQLTPQQRSALHTGGSTVRSQVSPAPPPAPQTWQMGLARQVVSWQAPALHAKPGGQLTWAHWSTQVPFKQSKPLAQAGVQFPVGPQ
jgi:hypothetical protein